MIKQFLSLFILFSLLFILAAGCIGPPLHSASDDAQGNSNGGPAESIYIIGERYHTGIIATSEFLKKYGCVLGSEIPPGHYGDTGWGDCDFYMGRSDGITGALNALFRSSSSVVHLRTFTSLDEWMTGSRYVIKVSLTEKQAALLCRFINESLVIRDGKPEAITKNYIRGSAFYESPLEYGLTNTCNTWIARALRFSGLKISPSMVMTVSQLKNRLLPIGTLIYPYNH